MNITLISYTRQEKKILWQTLCLGISTSAQINHIRNRNKKINTGYRRRFERVKTFKLNVKLTIINIIIIHSKTLRNKISFFVNEADLGLTVPISDP